MSTGALDAALNGATVLVTGGAGFVGSRVAISLARDAPSARIVAVDTLRRRGTELHLPLLAEAGVRFEHGDVRVADDVLAAAKGCHVLIDCSAEVAASAGYHDSPHRVLQTNLLGTINCLEAARHNGARVVFLSTSRVYPIEPLNGIAVTSEPTRWAIAADQPQDGVSQAGVTERFTLAGARTLYGATKLASELLLCEYGALYGLQYVVNRFGVIAGPGQMGREEQGVFTLWVARHHFGGTLTYRGWGGDGRQVRDLLHVDDATRLIQMQLTQWDRVNGRTYNAGGGRASNVSLCELTELCRTVTGRRLAVGSDPETNPWDVRVYVTDHTTLTRDTGWEPTHDPSAIVHDIHRWMSARHDALAPLFAGR